MVENEKRLSIKKLQMLCLIITGIMELLMITIGSSYKRALLDYLVVPCVVFWGIALVTDLDQQARKPLILGSAMVLWFLIAQFVQQSTGEHPYQSGVSWSAYLLAFPFAAVLQDGKEQKGLDLFAGCMICASVILAVFGMLLWVNLLPSSMSHLVFWDGARLRVNWHPNTAGSVFLIGTALSIRFFFKMQTKWKKAAMALLTALQFTSLTLTNSRTSILMACAFFSGTVFWAVCGTERKKERKKAVLCRTDGGNHCICCNLRSFKAIV